MTVPVIVALDTRSAEEAVRLARLLAPVAGGFKVGLELLMGPGPAVIAVVAELDKPVFADAKLHDIPNTVAGAARQLGRLGARWVSVHASGGSAMMEAAVDGLGAGAGGGETGILAVTVLTSLAEGDLAAVGFAPSPGRQVSRLTRLAAGAGVEGVVCSVREVGDVAQVAPGLLTVTPGIRRADSPRHDQARVATPAEAVRRGADWLVVGRDVTAASDPLEALSAIADEIEAARRAPR